jgi:hypothetical protein
VFNLQTNGQTQGYIDALFNVRERTRPYSLSREELAQLGITSASTARLLTDGFRRVAPNADQMFDSERGSIVAPRSRQ